MSSTPDRSPHASRDSRDSRDSRESRRRRRRRLVVAGVFGVVGLGGAIEGIPRIEGDLERRVDRQLSTAGIVGVSASFSGQDGTLRCAQALDDPAAAIAVAEDVWGVRVAELTESCRGGGSDTSGAASDTTDDADGPANNEPPETTGDTAATEVPGTTDAGGEGPDTTEAPVQAGAGPDVTVELTDGTLVLRGTVPDEASRVRLGAAAEAVVDPANVDDQLVVDAAIGGDPSAVETAVDGLAGMIGVMPGNLVSGSARLVGGALSLDGVYIDATARDVVEGAAGASGATSTLTPRQDASAADAAALADQLNALVESDPILFEPGSATLTADASAVVERVAAAANQFGGLAIEVTGHTDSDGDAARNLDLSRRRAQAVVDSLEDRGVTATLSAQGLGETRPIRVGGAEDKAASRRVEFAVITD